MPLSSLYSSLISLNSLLIYSKKFRPRSRLKLIPKNLKFQTYLYHFPIQKFPPAVCVLNKSVNSHKQVVQPLAHTERAHIFETHIAVFVDVDQ